MARVKFKLGRLDGWERLSVVLGSLLALTVAIYAPYDETGTLKKRGYSKVVPWYGVEIGSKREFTYEEVSGWVAGQAKVGGDLYDELGVASPPEQTYIDARLTILFMALAAALPYSLLAVVRWIAAGFRKHDESGGDE